LKRGGLKARFPRGPLEDSLEGSLEGRLLRRADLKWREFLRLKQARRGTPTTAKPPITAKPSTTAKRHMLLFFRKGG
jgi:hypothetical protein